MPVFRPIFARDPANPNDIASNATITLFDPADPNKTPVALTKMDGTALANPYTVNRQGEGPAFSHESLYIIGWEGGGHSGEFDSIEQMHADTLAARTAAENSVLLAQDAQAAATNAGATAGAEAAAAAQADLEARILAGDFKGPKGDTGLPGPDAVENDTAVAQYINTPGTQVNTALTATFVGKAVFAGDGITDDGPAFQAAYDDGAKKITLDSNKTYLIDTPVFLDKSSAYNRFVIETNGATIILGPNLPTTPQFTRDPATQWAFFGNTKRTALSGGVVECTDANRGTGVGTGGLLRFIARDGATDAKGRNAGLYFGNRTAGRCENMALIAGRALISWRDYADGSAVVSCHNRIGSAKVTDSALLHQIDHGDGIMLDGSKADSSLTIATFKDNNGVSIPGNITGTLEFNGCSAVSITAAHQESDIANTVGIICRGSQITIAASVLYAPRGVNPGPTILVDDTSTDQSSHVTLLGVLEQEFHRSGQGDRKSGPTIRVGTVNDGTTIQADGMLSKVVAYGLGGQWFDTVGPFIDSTTPAVQTALDAGRAIIASGSWRLSKREGMWGVTGPTANQVANAARPTILQAVSMSEVSGGAMTVDQAYSYAAATVDAAGNWTEVSPELSATVGAPGTVRLIVEVPAAPAELVIWRKLGVGASSTPDSHVRFPAGKPKLRVYDTGTNIAGAPWQTTSIPAIPPANRTVDALVVGGRTVTAPYRAVALNDVSKSSSTAYTNAISTTLEPGTYQVAGVLRYSAPVEDMNVKLAGPAGTTGETLTETPSLTGGAAVYANFAAVTLLEGVAGGADRVAIMRGWLRVTAAGTVALQFAQGSSTGNAIVIRAGSALTFTRVG